MERILSEDEKLRRAEEIYFRRNNRTSNFVQEKYSKQKQYFGSKILFNLILLCNIAIIVFCIQNKDFIFTKEFLQKCSQYNINLTDTFNGIMKNILQDNNVIENSFLNQTDENESEQENIVDSSTQQQVNIIEKNEQEITQENNAMSSLSEMDKDVENLKIAYQFEKPLDNAIVSSGFGARESEYQNVKGYHTGIDLAAEKGTLIKSAMEGIVTLVSDEGDYRKTCKDKM